jgi:hypothetical protein
LAQRFATTTFHQVRSTLSPAEIDAYRRDGFLLMPDFLSADELERWRSAVTRAATRRLDRNDGLSNAGTPEYYRDVFTQVSGLVRLDGEVRALLLDPCVGRLAAQLMGADRVRVWNDQALFKPPFGNPTAYHLDLPYWSFADERALTLWVALDEATVANGCMWYLAGSHLTARDRVSELTRGVGAIFEHYPELRDHEARPAPLPAGGAVWHNAQIAHGAGANMTGGSRRAMTCAYMPDGVTYNGIQDEFVYPDDVAATLRVGDPLSDERFNPLVPA